MSIKGVDTTDRTLTGAILKAGGYAFCCRYIRNAPTLTPTQKEWSRVEVAEKSVHGVRVVANFEWAERPTNSKTIGRSHANIFVDELASVGGPDWAPCYFSADYAAHAHDLDLYFEGVVDVLGPQRTGAYTNGELFRQLKADGLISLAWQSMSRSFPGNHHADGSWNHDGADIIQTSSGHIGSHSCDFDTATVANYGGWLLGEANPNAPTPPEENVALTSDDVNLLLTTNLGTSGPNVGQALQGTFQKVSALTPGTAPTGPVTLDPASVAAVAAAVVDLLDARLAN